MPTVAHCYNGILYYLSRLLKLDTFNCVSDVDKDPELVVVNVNVLITDLYGDSEAAQCIVKCNLCLV